MASCVLITNCCVAAKHLLQFSDSGPKAKPRCISLLCSASSSTHHSPSLPQMPGQSHGMDPGGHGLGWGQRVHPFGGSGNTALACRSAHPEQQSPATFCNEGSFRTPSSLPHSNPTVGNPSFNLNDCFKTAEAEIFTIFLQFYVCQFT